jgi:hypothetical protein
VRIGVLGGQFLRGRTNGLSERLRRRFAGPAVYMSGLIERVGWKTYYVGENGDDGNGGMCCIGDFLFEGSGAGFDWNITKDSDVLGILFRIL